MKPFRRIFLLPFFDQKKRCHHEIKFLFIASLCYRLKEENGGKWDIWTPPPLLNENEKKKKKMQRQLNITQIILGLLPPLPRVQCTLAFHPFPGLVVIQGGMLLLPFLSFNQKGRKGSFLGFYLLFFLYSNPLPSQRPRVLGPAPLHVLDIQKTQIIILKKNIFSFLLGKWVFFYRLRMN